MIGQSVTIAQFLESILQTLQMVFISLAIGSVLGTVLGIALVITRPGGVLENGWVFRILNPIINVLRSIPFIILMVAILPFTRFIVGTTVGTGAAIVPLVVFVGPYIARLVENSLLEVPQGIIEAADSMGATSWQIVWRFLLPEARSSLVLSLTTATIGLIGATAMAGTIGGGGLGDLAISYGYQRFDTVTMIVTVIVLVVMVQGIQGLGNVLARRWRRR
ncbi:methionine ABC transporter permease [Actinomyces polynesiensis]|uniref:methionine ABC transporter permease n=1 Tax=Actinomyces polynesiensis TaxID=1325934 RepID=UPI0005BE1481|nr:methionine ABC transporter permease [Actinomyces polynesiensis]